MHAGCSHLLDLPGHCSLGRPAAPTVQLSSPRSRPLPGPMAAAVCGFQVRAQNPLLRLAAHTGMLLEGALCLGDEDGPRVQLAFHHPQSDACKEHSVGDVAGPLTAEAAIPKGDWSKSWPDRDAAGPASCVNDPVGPVFLAQEGNALRVLRLHAAGLEEGPHAAVRGQRAGSDERELRRAYLQL